jgi:hypothetical protein
MVLERFNAIVFVGDDISRSIYLALNILLREDLTFGGLHLNMDDEAWMSCKCDNQFIDDCDIRGIQSSEEVKNFVEEERIGSPYYCSRTLLVQIG